MVEGACVGGGHELMLLCDLVIAAEDSIFGQTGARARAEWIPELEADGIPCGPINSVARRWPPRRRSPGAW